MNKTSLGSIVAFTLAAIPASASDFGLQGLPWDTQPRQPDFSEPAPQPLPGSSDYVIPLPDGKGSVDIHGKFRNFKFKYGPGSGRIEGEMQMRLR